MYKYRVAFLINDIQFNTWFYSEEKFNESDEILRTRFREQAIEAVKNYISEARRVPKTGRATALAVWSENISIDEPIQPLDAFEII